MQPRGRIVQLNSVLFIKHYYEILLQSRFMEIHIQTRNDQAKEKKNSSEE